MSDKNKEIRDISYPDQKIIPIHMDKEVKQSFIEYAMSVIVSRALPDVRDGLKPVHRRILYAMYEDHLTSDKPFRKSATTVGNVLGRYHPHGDSSVYDAMVRLAQSFSMRYPLVEGHGNFGNIDGDGAAAYRYTEARMAKLSNEMLADIEKEVVPFSPNYDNKLKEPDVLPSRFPNLLVNGSIGIAVGMATNIPPHNLGEVIDGTIYFMEHPDATVPELMNFIKGPDFPTYATIYGTQGILSAYTTGKGHITVRSRASVDEEKHRITITEIPYGVNKAMLVESMADLVKDKRVEGVSDIRDESGRNGMKIVVYLKKDANGQVVLNQFYKFTQLQDTFAVNMIALVNNEPKCLSLPQILSEYVKHQTAVIERRTKFDLDKALLRAHILEGQKIAIDNIDRVIAIIRGSAAVNDAKNALMQEFSLSDIQAQAIVDMTLGKLAGLERIKIETELAEKEALIRDLRDILANEGRIHEIIRTEMLEIKRKYSDARRTEIVGVENEIILEDLIERHTCLITMTQTGYIKRQPADTYNVQKRGGKGIIGMTTKEEDTVDCLYSVNSHAFLLMFTNFGRVYCKKAFEIPEAGRTAKGTSVVNVLDLMEGEKLTAIVDVPSFDDEHCLLMATRNGVIKKTNLSEFAFRVRGGKIAISLDEGDTLDFVRMVSEGDDVFLATADGQCLRFPEACVRAMGRVSHGVKSMTLAEGDYICGAAIAEPGKMLLTVTEQGYGKRTAYEEYAAHNRGGKGMITQTVNDKTGRLIGIASVGEDEDVMLINESGNITRFAASEVRVCGRASQGVILMRSGDSRIAHFTTIAAENEENETDISAGTDVSAGNADSGNADIELLDVGEDKEKE